MTWDLGPARGSLPPPADGHSLRTSTSRMLAPHDRRRAESCVRCKMQRCNVFHYALHLSLNNVCAFLVLRPRHNPASSLSIFFG
jgi:hypothetical protein